MKVGNIRILVEFAFWTALFFFPMMLFPGFWPGNFSETNYAFLGLLLTNGCLILFYYFHFFFLIPKFYFTKKYFPYIAIVVFCLLLMVLLLQLKKDFNPLPSPPLRYSNAAFIGSIVIRFAMMFLLSLGFRSYERIRQIEREKINAELSYLKAQINPHFLFNTLNSIYALTVKKSDSAPESITKLSSIMRYVIVDAARDLVSLEKELSYLTNYIELEKFRLTQRVKLSFSVSGNVTGQNIAPLIFIPFIENAFKHGVSTQEDSEIIIALQIEKNGLSLNVKNTKLRSRSNLEESTGLGIENTKRRLNLLYPAKHKLDIHDTGTFHSVNLSIALND